MSRPLGSPPTPTKQDLLGYYGPVRRQASHRYSTPSVSASARSLSPPSRPTTPVAVSTLPSHVPCKSRRPGSRRLYAGHRLANTRAPTRLISECSLGLTT